MYLLYVDESGDPGDPSTNGSQFLVLGAASLFEGKWIHLERELRSLIAKFFPNPPKPSEIHLTELRSGKRAYRRLTKRQREEMVGELCRMALDLLPTELTMFTIIADKRFWYSQNPGKTFEDLYSAMFEDLSSRFDLYLRRRYAEGAPCKGLIVADEHNQSLSAALRANQRHFQREGTRWASLYNLIETVFFLDSNDSPGLQLADLASFAVWRLVTANDSSIIGQISAIFDREPLTSQRTPGKWHGVKYIGNDPSVRVGLDAIWPP
ncbi:MAG TPA: DUF3800 domain-containing protein [Gemmataceae bacterium]|jgi:hypothetical protein